MSKSRNPWLRLVTICVGLHIACAAALADETPLLNCLEKPQPADVSQLRALAASVGTSSDIGNLTVIELGGEYDRGLAEPRQLVAQRFYQDHADDYDSLKLADGTRVEFTEVMTLCAQCHGQQMKDYEHGAHGGMNGYWDRSRGPQTKNNCVDCHNPHAPQFPKMQPTFKPRDRFLEKETEH